jgi:2-polyprenyl-3-methyl-5-hydroxy-6-metoxy-1,4-benzoquinol methylase
MIHRLRARAARAGVTNITGIVGDASITSPPGQFGIVILAHVLGEIPDRGATLAGCFRALEPGGVLSISEIALDPHFVSQRNVRRLADRAGFRHRETRGSWLSFTANFERPSLGSPVA